MSPKLRTIMRQRNSRALRVAIIGAGMMGYWHGRAARSLGARLVAIIDPDNDRARWLARRLRVGASGDGISELLERGRIDAVHICSPLPTHQHLASRAIEAGVHALVEKPLVDSADGTRNLLRSAQRHGVVLCPVHQIAFQGSVAAAGRALAGLGKLSFIDIRICSAGAEARPERQLDQIVGEILPHPLSVLRKLWPHVECDRQHWVVNRIRPGELSASGGFADAQLSMLISMHARPTRFEMRFSGERGAIDIDFFHGFTVRHGGRVSRLRKAAGPFETATKLFGAAAVNLSGRALAGEFAYPGLRNLTRAFYEAAAGGAPPPISAEDIIAVAATRDALLASSNVAARGMTPALLHTPASG